MVMEQVVNASEGVCVGVKINSQRVQTLRFVYDIVVLSPDEINLHRTLEYIDSYIE